MPAILRRSHLIGGLHINYALQNETGQATDEPANDSPRPWNEGSAGRCSQNSQRRDAERRVRYVSLRVGEKTCDWAFAHLRTPYSIRSVTTHNVVNAPKKSEAKAIRQSIASLSAVVPVGYMAE